MNAFVERQKEFLKTPEKSKFIVFEPVHTGLLGGGGGGGGGVDVDIVNAVDGMIELSFYFLFLFFLDLSLVLVGLGNRLEGLVSTFLLALLSERGFLVNFDYTDPRTRFLFFSFLFFSFFFSFFFFSFLFFSFLFFSFLFFSFLFFSFLFFSFLFFALLCFASFLLYSSQNHF